MSAHGMGNAPAVEPLIAKHLSPMQGGLLAPPGPVLPYKMDRFSASMFQSTYKANSLVVRALAMVGEWAQWINLLGLPDSEMRCIAGAPMGSGSALVWSCSHANAAALR